MSGCNIVRRLVGTDDGPTVDKACDPTIRRWLQQSDDQDGDIFSAVYLLFLLAFGLFCCCFLRCISKRGATGNARQPPRAVPSRHNGTQSNTAPVGVRNGRNTTTTSTASPGNDNDVLSTLTPSERRAYVSDLLKTEVGFGTRCCALVFVQRIMVGEL